MKIRVAELTSPVGPIAVAWRDDVVVSVHMQEACDRSSWETTYRPEPVRTQLTTSIRRRFPVAEIVPGTKDDPPLVALGRYFAGEVSALDTLKVDPGGTPFQAAVWERLRAIRPGTLATYGEIASALGSAAGARAVGAAVGANPIPIIIPCHRVVGATGQLTGFGGGIARKRWLLVHEGTQPELLPAAKQSP